MQQSLQSRVHEAGTRSQGLSRELQAEQSLVAELRQSLKRSDSHAARAEAKTVKLRGQIETSRSEAAAVLCKVEQQALEIAQLRERLERERRIHSTTNGTMQARIEDLSSSSARLQEEIASLHATIQVCWDHATSADMSHLWTWLHCLSAMLLHPCCNDCLPIR